MMMTKLDLAAVVLVSAVVAGASAPVLGQENPTAPLQLSGTYTVQNVTPSDDGTVNMDFSATITNEGGKDLNGKILLRDFSDNDKVWGRFGDNSIPAGGHVTVSGNVTVPKAVYASWSNGGSPPVFLYTQDDRGGFTAFNVPLSAVAAPAN
jgi:hypothetical protein